MEGLSLSLCATRTSGVAALDLASLNWGMFLYTSYGGPPWAGSASAGASGGRSVATVGLDPSVGSAQNGYTPSSHISQFLMSATKWSSVVSDSQYTMAAVFKVTSASSEDAGNPYNNKGILGDNFGAGIWMGFSTSGVHVGHHDASGYQGTKKACGTGAYHTAMGAFDGSSIRIWVDGVEGTAISAGNADTLGAELTLGTNWSSGTITGQILAAMAGPINYASQAAAIHTALVTRYGL